MPITLQMDNGPMDFEAVVFDCDGVLLETVAAKLDAFRRWVPDEYRHLGAAFNRYNRSAFGKSRSVQIRHFWGIMVGRQMEAGFLEKEVKRFTDICEPLVKESPWVQGSKEFVEHLVERHIPLFVVSGTPQGPLDTMLRDRNAFGYFEGVYGSPPDKVTYLRRILSEGEFEPQRVLFIGDAPPDAEAAVRAGVRFAYRRSEAARPKYEPEIECLDLRAMLD